MELGFRIPIISAGIPDSLSCILDSKLQDFGPRAKIPPIPESGVPCVERRRGYSSSSRKLSFWSQGVLSSGLVESEILGFGIWNSAQRIRNPTNDWNLESKFTDKDSLTNPVLKSGIHSVKSRIQDSLTLPFMERKILLLIHCPISLKTQKLKAFSTFQIMTSTCTRQISIYLLMMSLI